MLQQQLLLQHAGGLRQTIAAELLPEIGDVPAVHGLIPAVDLHHLPVVGGQLFGVVFLHQRFGADILDGDPVAEGVIARPRIRSLQPDSGAVLPVGGVRIQQGLAGKGTGRVDAFRIVVQLCRLLWRQGLQQRYGIFGEGDVNRDRALGQIKHHKGQHTEADQRCQYGADVLTFADLRRGAVASVQQIPPPQRHGAEDAEYTQYQPEGGQQYGRDGDQCGAVQQHVIEAVIAAQKAEAIEEHNGDQQKQQNTADQTQSVGRLDGVPQGVLVGVDLHCVGACGAIDVRTVVQLPHIRPAQLLHGGLVFLPLGVIAVLGLDVNAVAGGGGCTFHKDGPSVSKVEAQKIDHL